MEQEGGAIMRDTTHEDIIAEIIAKEIGEGTLTITLFTLLFY